MSRIVVPADDSSEIEAECGALIGSLGSVNDENHPPAASDDEVSHAFGGKKTSSVSLDGSQEHSSRVEASTKADPPEYRIDAYDEFSDRDGDRPSLMRRHRGALIALFLALLLQQLLFFALSRHGPPAPPLDSEDSTSWRAFIAHHTTQLQQSIMALAHSTLYLLSFYVQHLVDEVQVKVVQPLRGVWAPPPCAFRVAPSAVDEMNIVGSWQRQAFRRVIDHFQQQHDAPTVVTLVGSPHTGKTTLARRVHQSLVSNSCKSTLPLCCTGSLLVLSVRRDLGQSRFPARQQAWLTRLILQHARRYPRATMIVLQHVDSLPSTVMQWLVHDFWPSLDHGALLVLALESTTLTMPIFRAVREQHDRPPHALELELRHELAPWLDESSRKIPVLPLAPLTPLDLREILRLQSLHDKQRVTFLPRALEYLTDEHHVEYLLWKRPLPASGDDYDESTTPSESEVALSDFVFAGEGALALDPLGALWSSLRSHVEQCIQRFEWTRNETLILDVDSHDLLLAPCDNSKVPDDLKCFSVGATVCRFRV